MPPKKHKQETAERPSSSRTWLAVILLVIIPFAVYYNSLTLPFVFDDLNKIVRNPDIRKLSNITTRLIYPYSDEYHIPHRNDPSRPIVYLSFTLNYFFNNLNPAGYHLANVLLHILNALLIFFIIRKTIYCLYHKDALFYPFITALIFSVHTVSTSVVAYVFSRSNILETFLCLMALLLFIEAVKGRKTYVLSLACFLLALGSKQSAVTLPAIILLYDYIIISDLNIRSVLSRKYYHLPFWGIIIVYISIRYFYFGAIGDLEGIDVLWGRFEYLIIQPYVIIRYMLFLILPTGLCYYHYLNALSGITDPAFIVPVIIFILIGASLYKLYRRRTPPARLLLFFSLWFFIQLSPTSSIFPTTTAMVENRVYLPGIGFIALAVFAFLSGMTKSIWYSRKTSKTALVLLACYIMFLGVLSVKRNRFYENPVRLWQEIVTKYPDNVRGYNSLGNLYYEQGDYNKAVKEYVKAISIKPDYAETYNNLGIIFSIQQDYDSAIWAYEASIKIDPDIAEAHTNLGNLYSIKGKTEEAVQEYRKALDIDPNLAGAYYNLGVMYTKLKKYGLSMAAYQNALQIDPDYEDINDKIQSLEKHISR